jgi:ABC-type transporter Mla subunit MlaD
VIDNLTAFFGRFAELNVRSNPELDALVEQAQQLVRGIRPQQLRDSESLRQQVAAEMDRVQVQVEGLLTEAPRRRLVRNRPSANGGGHATAG